MKYGKFGTIARLNPPGRAEKSISFLCCDHSASEASIDSYFFFPYSVWYLPTSVERAHLKVSWQKVELFPRYRDAFDIRVFLLLQGQDSLEENDTLIFLGEHTHETFHKILGCI